MLSKKLIPLLISIVVSLLALEWVLQSLDPMAFQVRYDSRDMLSLAESTNQGYQIPPGEYRFRNWTVTIQADGTRLIPAACQVVILGDSVSFGYGVNDGETWGNYLARTFPNVTFTNTAQIGYNSENIREVYRAYPDADGFIYLIVDNDTGAKHGGRVMREQRLPLVSHYLIWLWSVMSGEKPQHDQPTQAEIDRFIRDTAPLFADSRVLLATYGSIAFTDGLGVDVIVPITGTIAPGDMHPNAAGSRDIAATLSPHVEQLVNRVCK
jgi:hypothetical protein